MSKGVRVVIDADQFIFAATEGKNDKLSYFGDEGEALDDSYVAPLKPYKKKFKLLIKDLMDAIAVETVSEDFKLHKKPRLIFSDPKGNFRYGIFPAYKSRRSGSERSEMFYRLRDWATQKYGYVANQEADEVVAYYVREKGYLGSSQDKDLIFGCVGRWFDCYHARMQYKGEVSEYEADRFMLTQCLAGDPVDSIPGIPGVGYKTALKLLDKYGYDFDGVVAAYESKGLTRDDAVLTRNLVDMSIWSKKKGLRLFSV